MSFKQEYEKKKMPFKDAVKLVQNGDSIYMAGSSNLSVPLNYIAEKTSLRT